MWHDPTSYDVTKHGPAYLKTAKLSSLRKAQVKDFTRRQAAFYDTQTLLGQTREVGSSPLGMVLQFLRALAHIHQTHHWQTNGTAFYADHKLFEQLYDESLEFIDQVAERAVGIDGAKVVDPFLQVSGMFILVSRICGHMKGDPQLSSLEQTPSPDEMVARSLRAETTLLTLLAQTLDRLRADEALSPGTSNLLEGVADKHEVFVYLLQRRLGETHHGERNSSDRSMYNYDRS